MAGMAGFEPTNARVKVWCLTAWRHPNEMAPRPRHTAYYIMPAAVLQQPICNNFILFAGPGRASKWLVTTNKKVSGS